MKKADFLLEIGCEEIPARMLSSAQAQLAELLESALSKARVLGKGSVKSWATPRRLAVYFPSLLPTQPDSEEEHIGPPWSAAFHAEGTPTKAADGFARKHGVKVSQLQKISTDKGEYVGVRVRQKGEKTGRILARLIPQVIEKIEFPRRMRWQAEQSFGFIRPIRWLVALFAGQPIRIAIGDVHSGTSSRGHRAIWNRPVPITRAAGYERALRKRGVIADPAARRKKIETEAARVAKQKGLRVRPDQALLDTLANMTEHPVALAGSFAEEFLTLPDEVLTTVMRHHQNYFSVQTRSGKLAPHFVTILDRNRDRGGIIRRGHEAVLEARLRDAQFFWEADQAQTLEERLPELERVTFHSKLGSYGDKVGWVEKLARWAAGNSWHECRRADGSRKGRRGGRHADTAQDKSGDDRRRADIDSVTRAAKLCKADLTTQLVGEFPELQGIAGGLYATAQGEPETAATAIYQHYRPAGPEDALPNTPEAAVLCVADKLDTVTGCFIAGSAPTGSRDPYGLRRAASGIVRLIIETGVHIDLGQAILEAAEIVGESMRPEIEDATRSVNEFFADRVGYYFREVRQHPYDEVNACMAAGWADLLDLESRLAATRKIRPTSDFEALAASFKRIRNILEQAGGVRKFEGREVMERMLEAGAERSLFEDFRTVRTKVSALRQERNYTAALQAIASLRPAVDSFFDDVLVNAPETEVRQNRLSLLAYLLGEFSTIADFSEIVTPSK